MLCAFFRLLLCDISSPYRRILDVCTVFCVAHFHLGQLQLHNNISSPLHLAKEKRNLRLQLRLATHQIKYLNIYFFLIFLRPRNESRDRKSSSHHLHSVFVREIMILMMISRHKKSASRRDLFAFIEKLLGCCGALDSVDFKRDNKLTKL